jgi:DNA primase small subunit
MAFVQKKFREYYTQNCIVDESLSMIDKREFGFASFEGWMLRHKSFSSKDELSSFLSESVPKDAYFSCAYYEEPESEMEKKGWLGADLIFDIDADHIPTSCDKIHDEWTCGRCGFAGKGIVPDVCPACGSEKFDDSTWPCEVCLASAKNETIKLLDILTKDFGFSQKELRVFFSGHRGYHVHVEAEAIKSLDSVARKEIVDYVCGLGFDAASHGIDEKALARLSLKDTGWRGRIAHEIHTLLQNAKLEDFRKIGLNRNVSEALMRNRGTILRNLDESRPWNVVKGVGSETWKRITEHAAQSRFASVDTVVTTDTHRLIRLGGALHGKTGLRKIEFSPSEIEEFDPFTSAVAFEGGAVRISVSNSPKFRIGNETFGPYKKREVELPTAAALLLVCKKRAEVAD